MFKLRCCYIKFIKLSAIFSLKLTYITFDKNKAFKQLFDISTSNIRRKI